MDCTRLIAVVLAACFLTSCAFHARGPVNNEIIGDGLGNKEFYDYFKDRLDQYHKMRDAFERTDEMTSSPDTHEVPSKQKEPDEDELVRFVQTGYGYVDHKCAKYFTALNNLHKQKRERVTTANILTGGLSGLMAALQSSAKEVAAVAIGGTATASLIETSDSHLLFELDPATTQSLVGKARDTYRTEQAAKIKGIAIGSFENAVYIVQGYAELCTPSRIERMVQEAVASGTPRVNEDRSPLTLMSRQAISQASERIRQSLKMNANLSNEQLAALFWLTEHGGADDQASRKAISGILPSDLWNQLFDSKTNKISDVTAIRHAFSSLIILGMDGPLRTDAERLRAALLPASVSAAPGNGSTPPAVTSKGVESTPAPPSAGTSTTSQPPSPTSRSRRLSLNPGIDVRFD